MPGIISQRTYNVDKEYAGIKERATKFLHKYLGYPGLIAFNDSERSVTFSTERLIPAAFSSRPRVMLLCSNPHPHSVHQGMFLSPNTKGRENPFWITMEAAGWMPISKENRNPGQLADICLKADYGGPFEYLFYCYYAFPTDFPEDISRIFGREYFRQVIEPDSIAEFRQTIHETTVDAVVTFNKGIFNLVSENPVDRYIEQLEEGGMIRSEIKGIERSIPVFLTFPTGWRYHKDYRHLRKASLDTIRTAIESGGKPTGK
jgi:hypothetical protein